MESSFGKKILSGSLWILLFRWMSRLLGVVSVIILARVLLPEDYGLIAKALILSSFLEMVTEFGFFTALVRNKKATPQDYNTVWTLCIIRGVFLFTVIMLTAGLMADFFNDERIYPIILVYGVIALLYGFLNVGVVDFHKKMNFNMEFKLNILSRLAEFFTTLFVALVYKTYWAFPLGSLVGMLVKLVTSYIVSNYRPRFSLASLDKIFSFSKWFFVYEAMSALSAKIDVILLSKFSSTETLGLYTISKEISGMPSTEIAMPVARAALPALAELVDDKPGFQKLNVQILSSVLALALPAVIGICLIADYVVLLLLGPNWLGAVVFLQILAFVGISRVSVACAISAVTAIGRADLLGRYSFAMFFVRAAFMAAGILIGEAVGLAWGVLAASLTGMVLMQYIQSSLGIMSVKSLFLASWRVVLAALLMAAVLGAAMFSPLVSDTGLGGWMALPLTALGILVYGLSLLLLCKLSNWPDGPETYLLTLLKGKKKL
ncbi:lipopolysaccharide biosynthesis protein [Alishewanella sp. BS5-314]|uniref:lipopolysaccharide biosynthesis protein n=1 Tax=Alishewanella sp. BS5-314 TaxID=2755587 RepID=UPI0021BA680A|nr:lipopolysaccharide biosynthesis protein [Alishewanella sp. BS5-314]MCT8125619.1 lipopolysaccharide biosynthesis protein [Alishewanella sp. BS5-314]